MQIRTIGDLYELSKRNNYIQWELLIQDLTQREIHTFDEPHEVLRKYFLPENKGKLKKHVSKLMKERTDERN